MFEAIDVPSPPRAPEGVAGTAGITEITVAVGAFAAVGVAVVWTAGLLSGVVTAPPVLSRYLDGVLSGIEGGDPVVVCYSVAVVLAAVLLVSGAAWFLFAAAAVETRVLGRLPAGPVDPASGPDTPAVGEADGVPAAPGPSRPPDPEVLALVDEPFRSVADADERLHELERHFRRRGDRRAVFLTVYARVTERVGEGIRAGEFHDPDWMADYLVAFADLYRRALLAFERGDADALPAAWRVSFGASSAGTCLVSQDAVLGINAHVTYDLALALDAAGLDGDREAKYADHRRVNDILRSLVTETQRRLARRYAPGLAAVRDLPGPLREVFPAVALAVGRETAWHAAVAMASGGRLRERLATRYLRVASTALAYLLAVPATSRTVLGRLRRLEGRPPGVDATT